MNRIFLYTLLLMSLLISSVTAQEIQEIGVHIVVDSSLVSGGITENDRRQQMEMFVLEANEFYEDSGVNIQLVIANLDFRDISNSGAITDSGTIISNIGSENGVFNNIFQDADRHGADYIVAIVGDLGDVCGQAVDVNTTQQAISLTNRAYAVSDIDCDADTFTHELGHLMGMAHGDQVSIARDNTVHSYALTNYARGWGNIVDLNSAGSFLPDGSYGYEDESVEPGEYSTLMVGNHVVYWTGTTFNVKVPLFSSPNVTNVACGFNGICGDANAGDVVRALNENRATYAAHEERDVDLLQYFDANFSTCISSNYANTEIADLDTINCSSLDIGSINGIEQLNALSDIHLSHNRVVNVSPLEALSQAVVSHINLYGNDTAICHQLDRLEARYPGKVSMPDRCLNISALVASLSLLIQ